MQRMDLVKECLDEIQADQLAEFKRTIRTKIGEIVNLQKQRDEISLKIAKAKNELAELELAPIDAAAVLNDVK